MEGQVPGAELVPKAVRTLLVLYENTLVNAQCYDNHHIRKDIT